jgi:hypothetical protein
MSRCCSTQVLTDKPDQASVKRFYAYISSLPRGPAQQGQGGVSASGSGNGSGNGNGQSAGVAAAGPARAQAVRGRGRDATSELVDEQTDSQTNKLAGRQTVNRQLNG